jgi:hypothetical protein
MDRPFRQGHRSVLVMIIRPLALCSSFTYRTRDDKTIATTYACLETLTASILPMCAIQPLTLYVHI